MRYHVTILPLWNSLHYDNGRVRCFFSFFSNKSPEISITKIVEQKFVDDDWLIHSPEAPPYSPICIKDDDEYNFPIDFISESQIVGDQGTEILSTDPNVNETNTDPPQRELKSVQDIIEMIKKDNCIIISDDYDSYDEDSILDIDIRRDFLLKDAIREGKKTKFLPNKIIRVNFIGKQAVDTGGPRREFWRLLVQNAKDYCKGKEGSMAFAPNTLACQKSEFKILGMYVAVSIPQGGYGFPILHPIVYNFITMGKYIGVSLIDEHVPDPFISHLVKEIRECKDDQSIQAVFEDQDYCNSV